jgi:hypothetical protein
VTRNSLRYLTIALILAHVAGGTAPADAAPAGAAGMALRFVGDNDAIRVKRSKILEPGELTIELWAKLPGGDAKQEPQGENARFVRKVSAPDRRGYIFGPSQAGVPFAQFRYDVPIRYLPDTLANNAYGNDWHHFAAIYSLSEAVLVVDGLEVARQKHERERLGHDADADFSIGADGFRGCIDELKIWQTTRTVQAIRDGMYHRSTGREPGLIAYWRFDDRRLENTASTALEILTPLADDS